MNLDERPCYEFALNKYVDYTLFNAIQNFCFCFYRSENGLGKTQRAKKQLSVSKNRFLWKSKMKVKYCLNRDRIHNLSFISLTHPYPPPPSFFSFFRSIAVFHSLITHSFLPPYNVVSLSFLSFSRMNNDEPNVTIRTRIVLKWFSFQILSYPVYTNKIVQGQFVWYIVCICICFEFTFFLHFSSSFFQFYSEEEISKPKNITGKYNNKKFIDYCLLLTKSSLYNHFGGCI